ncbi:MAG: DUF4124 domain-containing protein [Usitatibacteraceae bacterium]
MKSPVQLFIAAAILLATATVAAQVYKWVDKDGKVQYGDTPPPASATKVEAKKVDAPPPPPPAVAATPSKSLQEQAKDYEKRKTDAAAKSKKNESEQQNEAVKASACSEARGAVRELESGRPIARASEGGGREYMDDAARQTEMAKARKAIADFCKS